MATTFSNVLSTEELDFLINAPETLEARTRLNKVAKFTIILPAPIKQKLLDTLGLNLFGVESIPMRWIEGDTTEHMDADANSNDSFDKTYLMYLTDSIGTFDIDGQSYSINKGAAYIFSEGVSHSTSKTGLQPRLLLGPMNEIGAPVGAQGPAIKITPPYVYGKKFVGGNRDSSAITVRRTMTTLTNLKSIDIRNKSDTVNTQDTQSALTRVRGGGYVVPKKVTGKYLS